MPVPKKKISKARRDKRRSHDHLASPGLATCPNCHSPKLPHVACPECGFYNRRQVVEPRKV